MLEREDLNLTITQASELLMSNMDSYVFIGKVEGNLEANSTQWVGEENERAYLVLTKQELKSLIVTIKGRLYDTTRGDGKIMMEELFKEWETQVEQNPQETKEEEGTVLPPKDKKESRRD